MKKGDVVEVPSTEGVADFLKYTKTRVGDKAQFFNVVGVVSEINNGNATLSTGNREMCVDARMLIEVGGSYSEQCNRIEVVNLIDRNKKLQQQLEEIKKTKEE